MQYRDVLPRYGRVLQRHVTQLRLPPQNKAVALRQINGLQRLAIFGLASRSIGALPLIHSGTTNFPSFVPAGVGGAGARRFLSASLACFAASLAATNFSFSPSSSRNAVLTSLKPNSVLANSRCVSSSRLFAERRMANCALWLSAICDCSVSNRFTSFSSSVTLTNDGGSEGGHRFLRR